MVGLLSRWYDDCVNKIIIAGLVYFRLPSVLQAGFSQTLRLITMSQALVSSIIDGVKTVMNIY